MTGVDGHVVHDAFVNNCCLGLGHTWNPIWSQSLPGSRYVEVALDADPQHPKVPEGCSQPFLTLIAPEKYLVNDYAGSAGGNCRKAEVPRRFKVPPFKSDVDLSGFPYLKERSTFKLIVRHGPDQVIDSK
jgi:hypothetical protein